MNYRIIIETEASGKKWYYVQRRYMFCFWRYLGKVQYGYKIGWQTLEQAEAQMQSDVDERYAKNQKKVVKREYISR